MKNNLLYMLMFILLGAYTLSASAEDPTFTTTHFSGSENCSECHGQTISINSDWGASMMANATKDPYWQAKVASELKRNSHLSSLINDKCSVCHAPMANYEMKQLAQPIEIFGASGMLNSSHALNDAALNGVSCTVCHQIEDSANLGTLDGFSGQFTINNTKTIYGQYVPTSGDVMTNNSGGYTPVQSAHVSDSAMCATCHNLKTPFVDADGNVVSTTPDTEFPEQMPYTEWENSIFDDLGSNPKSCQDCHMPKISSKVSSRPMNLTAKPDFAKHELVGANTVMQTMLKNNSVQLGVTSTDAEMATGINRSREMLKSAAVVEILSAEIEDEILEVRVKIQNNSGHKTPTGYPSRRMWLHMNVTDKDGNTVFESGKINSDGSIVGADNDNDAAIYEPHYDVISSADEVQIYESVMGNTDSNVTYTLLRGAQYLKDNRLTPQGFNKLAVSDDIAVSGAAFSDDNFNSGVDEITYRIAVADLTDVDIDLSLNYQAISHGFIRDIYADVDLTQVSDFKTMYDAQSLKYETISSVQRSLPEASADSDSDSASTTDTPQDTGKSSSGSLSNMEIWILFFCFCCLIPVLRNRKIS